jgi:tetratricopeptide (TPR) repeat protein
MRGGNAEFDGLPPGRYTVEVVAPGYRKMAVGVEISALGEHAQSYLVLMPDSPANPAAGPAGPPILAPNAQKELSKALEALRANKPEDAKKPLEKVSRNAGNPDVNYAWGMYYAELKDWTKAKSYWEKAVQICPSHAFSLAALGQSALQDGDSPAAIGYFERAGEATPSSWRFQELLAEAYLEHQEYEQAQKHAEHAIELGKERASVAQLVLAKALLKRNEPHRAEKALDIFLAEQPSGPRAEEATRLLDSLRQPAAAAPAQPAAVVVKRADTPAPSVAALVPAPKWMPPNVDESMPAVETGVACPLQKVQEEAGKRVRGFVDAVNRIAATEALDHETIDRYGFPSKRESRHYSYVASVEETQPGMYTVEEYRNGTMRLDIFPGRLATLGLTSLVMIFHPAYRDEYEVTCEGLSRWHGGLAWQVHFRQRPDKPARLSEYRTDKGVFPVSLRGRAWIGVDTFQVVSIETDIVAPISRIRLNAEHVSIEYMPVQFRRYNEELWLPQSAEIFIDFGGRRMHRRHHFSDYLLFSVDEKQKIAAPAITNESNPVPTGPHQNF